VRRKEGLVRRNGGRRGEEEEGGGRREEGGGRREEDGGRREEGGGRREEGEGGGRMAGQNFIMSRLFGRRSRRRSHLRFQRFVQIPL
jgi:hypothetical protein